MRTSKENQLDWHGSSSNLMFILCTERERERAIILIVFNSVEKFNTLVLFHFKNIASTTATLSVLFLLLHILFNYLSELLLQIC